MSRLIVSFPCEVLAARHAWRLTESRTNRTLPSHMDTFNPPGCRLRATCIRGRVLVEVVVQGGFPPVPLLHPAPVITSGSLLFGRLNAVNPAPPPHHENPR